MTRDDIIRMAREAGLWPAVTDVFPNELERFAALVEQHLIQQGYRQCAKGQRTTQYCGLLQDAVLAEREACARILDANAAASTRSEILRCILESNAAAIRARKP